MPEHKRIPAAGIAENGKGEFTEMKCQDIFSVLEERYPLVYACDWDNVGLLAGDREQEVRRVYIALDATDAAVEEAVRWKADLLLTHHPMIFGSIKRVTADDYIGERLLRLIRNGISCYAMHTNYDVMGMAELAAGRIGLKDTFVLEEVFDGEGIGRVGQLPGPVTLKDCAEGVKKAFGLPNVKIFGNLNKIVKMVAVSPGAGKSMARPALAAGADVLITGDMDHHTGIDMDDCGLSIIDAGHYGIEHIYIEDIRKLLEERFPDLLVKAAEIAQPFTVI